MAVRVATWLGGPWDGQTMELFEGMTFVPAIDPEQRRSEEDVEFAEVVQLDESAPQPRFCPVVEQSDGRLVIDWNAGV